MSDTKTPLPPLVSDEQIERMSGDPINAQAISAYAFGEVIGRARGLASAREIYEAELQRLRSEKCVYCGRLRSTPDEPNL
jgi:hypothetical protein